MDNDCGSMSSVLCDRWLWVSKKDGCLLCWAISSHVVGEDALSESLSDIPKPSNFSCNLCWALLQPSRASQYGSWRDARLAYGCSLYGVPSTKLSRDSVHYRSGFLYLLRGQSHTWRKCNDDSVYSSLEAGFNQRLCNTLQNPIPFPMSKNSWSCVGRMRFDSIQFI